MPRFATHRITRPEIYNPYAAGGIGVVPRRGFDQRTRYLLEEVAKNPVRCLQDWAGTAPLRLLDVLVRIHPLAQMALSNDLALAFLPDSTRFIAVENATDKQANEEGTAALDDMWRRLPADLGGQTGLSYTIGYQASVYGMGCIEGVAKLGVGVTDAPDFSPVSVRWADGTGDRRLQQIQGSDWIDLPASGDDATVFAVPFRGSRENPYGIPRFAAFLNEGLADIFDQRNVGDVMRAIAYPHLGIEFPVEQIIKFAEENAAELLLDRDMDAQGNKIPLTPLKFAMQVFDEFMKKMEGLLADDVFFMPAGAKASVINAGAEMDGAISVIEMRRLRLCQSLDHLPSLLGITDGGTLAYSSVQFKQYASKLESLRGFANSFLIRLCNLHLRALGINLIARADTEPIQTTDRLNEAQARALEIANTLKLVDRGYYDDEHGATMLTGSGVAVPARAEEAHKAALAGASGRSSDTSAASDGSTPTAQGSTKKS